MNTSTASISNINNNFKTKKVNISLPLKDLLFDKVSFIAKTANKRHNEKTLNLITDPKKFKYSKDEVLSIWKILDKKFKGVVQTSSFFEFFKPFVPELQTVQTIDFKEDLKTDVKPDVKSVMVNSDKSVLEFLNEEILNEKPINIEVDEVVRPLEPKHLIYMEAQINKHKQKTHKFKEETLGEHLQKQKVSYTQMVQRCQNEDPKRTAMFKYESFLDLKDEVSLTFENGEVIRKGKILSVNELQTLLNVLK